MSDPVSQAQHVADVTTGALGGAGALGGMGLLAKGVAKLVGVWRKARTADMQGAADEWQELHTECKREVADLRERADRQDAVIAALDARVRQEHAPCRAVEAAQQKQIDELRHEVKLMRGAIDGLLNETPRHGIDPREVQRAAVAQKET